VLGTPPRLTSVVFPPTVLLAALGSIWIVPLYKIAVLKSEEPGKSPVFVLGLYTSPPPSLLFSQTSAPFIDRGLSSAWIRIFPPISYSFSLPQPRGPAPGHFPKRRGFFAKDQANWSCVLISPGRAPLSPWPALPSYLGSPPFCSDQLQRT